MWCIVNKTYRKRCGRGQFLFRKSFWLWLPFLLLTWLMF